LDVREKGDAWYQAVGKKSLDLIGAEGVTETWGRGVKVALMDTPVEGVDKIEGETAGHGTAMRSLIQGQSGAARGAAPGAELLAFSVLDQDGKGNSFGLAEAILKATDQGARVINMSLGSEGDSPVVRDAVAYALARNVVLVAAAGNEAVNRVSYPAAYDGVIAVASVDAGGSHLYFSNRGKALDLAAPGYAVDAAWPGGKIAKVSGTSASTALVTGAVAALLSREPGLSGRQAADLITKYADSTGLPGAVEEIGSGVVNLQRVFERNQRGLVDLAVGGVTLKEEGLQGRILVGIQNRGNETVNSPSLEISVGEDRRKFYFGSLAPGGTATESLAFDLARYRQGELLDVEATVEARGDQKSGNDFEAIKFSISKE
jgi:subtilisin family serine protease